MTFEQYLVQWALGRLRTDQLPAVALQALEEGREAPSFAALAGAPSNASSCELLDAWRLGLLELGVEVPSRAAAGRALRDDLASQVASGALHPREGAEAIVALALDLHDVLPNERYAGDGLGVAKLVGLFDDHDDVPDHDAAAHQEIDDEIRAECRRIALESAREQNG